MEPGSDGKRIVKSWNLKVTNAAPCYAAQSAKVSVVGSDGVQYTTLPDAKTLKKDVEFEPKVMEDELIKMAKGMIDLDSSSSAKK